MYAQLVKTLITLSFLSLASCGQGYTAYMPEENVDEAELVRRDGTGEEPTDLVEMKAADFTASETHQILSKYGHLDPQRVVPAKLLEQAVVYYEANKNRFSNKNFISVIDFSKKSSKPRFFVIDLVTGGVWALRTAHGSGSDHDHDGFATSFGNISGSKKSSLGFYRTAETYPGSNGYSLRLDGLSTTNSKARSRAIVIHGANYVSDRTVIQGRSSGCPAVSHTNRDKLINRIKNGSLIYAALSGVN